MTAFEIWQKEREHLSLSLHKENSMADVVFSIRHALMQTEQNLLAEQSDDILRQQLGVLFSLAKGSLSYVEVPITATTWVAQSEKKASPGAKKILLRLLPCLLCAACGILCYFKNFAPGWILSLLSTFSFLFTLLPAKKPAAAKNGASPRVTLEPDVERLLSIVDGQMRSIDRCMNDFAYLNNSMRGDDHSANAALAGRMADLMEAVYDLDPEDRSAVEDTAQSIFADMGLTALDYSAENAKLFTTLPSKTENRTIAPAIVATDDYRLIRRGTAAVKL